MDELNDLDDVQMYRFFTPPPKLLVPMIHALLSLPKDQPFTVEQLDKALEDQCTLAEQEDPEFEEEVSKAFEHAGFSACGGLELFAPVTGAAFGWSYRMSKVDKSLFKTTKELYLWESRRDRREKDIMDCVNSMFTALDYAPHNALGYFKFSVDSIVEEIAKEAAQRVREDRWEIERALKKLERQGKISKLHLTSKGVQVYQRDIIKERKNEVPNDWGLCLHRIQEHDRAKVLLGQGFGPFYYSWDDLKSGDGGGMLCPSLTKSILTQLIEHGYIEVEDPSVDESEWRYAVTQKEWNYPLEEDEDKYG